MVITLGPAAIHPLAGVVSLAYEGTTLSSVRGPFFWNRWKNVGRENAARIWGDGLRELGFTRGESISSQEDRRSGRAWSGWPPVRY